MNSKSNHSISIQLCALAHTWMVAKEYLKPPEDTTEITVTIKSNKPKWKKSMGCEH